MLLAVLGWLWQEKQDRVEREREAAQRHQEAQEGLAAFQDEIGRLGLVPEQTLRDWTLEDPQQGELVRDWLLAFEREVSEDPTTLLVNDVVSRIADAWSTHDLVSLSAAFSDAPAAQDRQAVLDRAEILNARWEESLRSRTCELCANGRALVEESLREFAALEAEAKAEQALPVPYGARTRQTLSAWRNGLQAAPDIRPVVARARAAVSRDETAMTGVECHQAARAYNKLVRELERALARGRDIARSEKAKLAELTEAAGQHFLEELATVRETLAETEQRQKTLAAAWLRADAEEREILADWGREISRHRRRPEVREASAAESLLTRATGSGTTTRDEIQRGHDALETVTAVLTEVRDLEKAYAKRLETRACAVVADAVTRIRSGMRTIAELQEDADREVWDARAPDAKGQEILTAWRTYLGETVPRDVDYERASEVLRAQDQGGNALDCLSLLPQACRARDALEELVADARKESRGVREVLDISFCQKEDAPVVRLRALIAEIRSGAAPESGALPAPARRSAAVREAIQRWKAAVTAVAGADKIAKLERDASEVLRLLRAKNCPEADTLRKASEKEAESILEALQQTNEVNERRVRTRALTAELLAFAAAGDVPSMTRVIQAPDFDWRNARDSRGRTVLHHAAAGLHVEAIRFLVEKRAFTHVRDDQGQLPFEAVQHQAGLGGVKHPIHAAILRKGMERVATALIVLAPSLEARDDSRSTALHCAAKTGSVGLVRVLVERGADTTAQDKLDRTPLLLLARAMPDRPDSVSDAVSADLVAPLSRNPEALTRRWTSGGTPLHEAVASRRYRMVAALLERGAPVDIRNGNQETALHEAADNGYDRIVRLLLRNGADVLASTELGTTPLHTAVHGKKVDTADILLKHAEAKDVRGYANIKGANGFTPLHHAAYFLQKEMIELLVRHGAKGDIPNDQGLTPIQMAEKANAKDLADLMR